jgi:Arc/MetJ-type ribon-helix-helix transcriptional regulator
MSPGKGRATSITVALDPNLEARLRARVDAGEFESLDAAVEEATREFVLLEPPLDELRAKIDAGTAELERGEGIELDIDDLKRIGRQRLRERSNQSAAAGFNSLSSTG